MALTFEITVRDVYGKPKLYPVNGPAQTLARIAGTKTLEPKVLRAAMSGFDAVIKYDMTAHGETIGRLLREAL